MTETIPFPEAANAPLPLAGFYRRVVAFSLDQFLVLLLISPLGILLPAAENAQQEAEIAQALAQSGLTLDPSTQSMLNMATTLSQEPSTLAVLLGVLIAWGYFALFDGFAGRATLGKGMTGLRVMDETAAPLSGRQALLRGLYKAIAVQMTLWGFVALLGFFGALFTSRKQGLHDLIARTIVLKTR